MTLTLATTNVVPTSGLFLLEIFWLAVSFIMTTLFTTFVAVLLSEQLRGRGYTPLFIPLIAECAFSLLYFITRGLIATDYIRYHAYHSAYLYGTHSRTIQSIGLGGIAFFAFCVFATVLVTKIKSRRIAITILAIDLLLFIALLVGLGVVR